MCAGTRSRDGVSTVSVGIFNLYMHTLGGGERSTLEFARAMRDITHQEVTVYCQPSSKIIRPYLENIFSLELESIRFITGDAPSLCQAVYAAQHDIFVNHSYQSSLPNPCDVGLYAVMFPVKKDKSGLLTSYDYLICNSHFTAQYAKLYTELPESIVRVIYPPMACRPDFSGDEKDWRVAVNIGRYSSGGHCKHQYEVAQAVARVNGNARSPLRLDCFGRVTELSYLERCRSLESDQVSFKINATEDSLATALSRAGLYIHGCGLGLEYGVVPELCEHLGLAILEAMSAGCIPLAVSRGGAVEFIEHGVNGFLYDSIEELEELLLMLEAAPTSSKLVVSRQARETARAFTSEGFRDGLRRLLATPRAAPTWEGGLEHE
jgi:glycosyltransferase involved in cell wall biosynthesis